MMERDGETKSRTLQQGKGTKKRSAWIRRAILFTGLPAGIIGFIMLITHMPGASYEGPFEPLTEEERSIGQALEEHVGTLALTIGERNLWRFEPLQASAAYVAGVFSSLGFEVARQEYGVRGRTVHNLEVEIPGNTLPDEIILVGAHYDSVAGSPGANDNASGVAALLVMAQLLAGRDQARTVRLVAFVNEEPPFFQTNQMGSRVYASRARKRGDDIIAMLSLETIGCYRSEKGSQHYPFPFSLFYPDIGNFLGFVGNLSSRKLVRRAIGSFRDHTPFPSEGAAAPGWIIGIGWSDHWAFWKEGYSAIMVTDTALFRYPYYHSANDTPEKIDYDRMARVVAGITRVVSDLAEKGLDR
jgi:hypothetical protein